MKETILAMRRCLIPVYGAGEAQAMIREIFRVLKGWNTTELTIRTADDYQLSDFIKQKIADILKRLQKQEPLQYILGTTDFYGLNLHVESGVLIPRPETENLVRQIVADNRATDLRVADLGTGSGAIAIALSRNLNFPSITAIDISPVAVKVAHENAKALKCRNIDIEQADMTNWHPEAGAYDIIVSNPPYIDDSERADMDVNVKDYEPAEALFVPDNDPLKFYRPIIAEAQLALKPGGYLYFEINPRHADELKALLNTKGFTNITLWRDIQGLYRYIKARKPAADGWN